MKTLITTLLLTASMAVCAQGYKNPILPGFHPDPSICHVDGDYYVVNSSFQFFPGVPVSHSRDLVHWETIGYCLNQPSQLQLNNADYWGGIYAPSIRYHNGKFYMITTNCSGKGNFFVTATDPAGPWSEPIWVNQGGIDPCPFFDEDGKNYYVGTSDGAIRLFQIDVETGKRMGDVKTIWTGTGGRYPEGPKIYKKDGYYYLMIAEGGTEYGHKVTIARSKDITGPYESNPANPILTHFNHQAESSPIQGLGHADLVQAEDSTWWVVCLGFRPQSYNHHVLGRETFLAPVTWEKNAWPVINGDGTIQLDMKCKTLPSAPVKTTPARDNFSSDKLDFCWNYIDNPATENYSLAEHKGYLRLKASTKTLDDKGSPTFLGRRQENIKFTASTALDFGKLKNGSEAGITIYMASDYHYDIAIVRNADQASIKVTYHLGALKYSEKLIPVKGDKVYLQVSGSNDLYGLLYSTNGKQYDKVGTANTRFISSETAGGFTGVYIGMYAQAGNADSNYADFDWFEYRGE